MSSSKITTVKPTIGKPATIDCEKTSINYQDELGSTSHVAGTNGQLLEYYKYNLYGAPTYWSPANSRLQASNYRVADLGNGGARWIPEIGLYDDRNRFMSPDLGRFLQPDPIGFKGDASNLYGYCGNDWANRTDSTGLDAVSDGDGFNHYVVGPQLRPMLENLKGSVITVLPNKSPDRRGDYRLSGQCAKAGQFLAGIVTKDGVYGVPKTGSDQHPNWFKGTAVTGSTPNGTLVATGWHNGHYPSWSPQECAEHGVPVNHVGILVRADSKSVTVIDQFVTQRNGNVITVKPLGETTYPKGDWSVVRVPDRVGPYDSAKNALAPTARPPGGTSGSVRIDISAPPQASDVDPSMEDIGGVVIGGGRGDPKGSPVP